MTAPYVAVPIAVFEALSTREINEAQFLVLCACYFWANRGQGYRVDSYSAERVCLWLGRDADEKTKKIFQRALHALVDCHIVRSDYKRGIERPYHVWVVPPEQFSRIGTAEENRLSLWQGVVLASVAASVAASADATLLDANIYEESDPSSVGASVAANGMSSSSKDQETNAEKEIPLNSPLGELLPSLRSPLKGEDAAAGLKPTQENQNIGQRKPLNTIQCDALDKLTLRYVAFVNWVWNFVPDEKFTRNLLHDFRPEELLYIQLEKFPPGNKFQKTTMAQFFMKGARSLIEAARLRQTSLVEPNWGYALLHVYDDKKQEFAKQWQYVLDGAAKS